MVQDWVRDIPSSWGLQEPPTPRSVTPSLPLLARTLSRTVFAPCLEQVTAADGYAFFRLLTEGIPETVTVSATLDQTGPLNKAPPLAVYVQKNDPSPTETSLSLCSQTVRTECRLHASNACVCNGLKTVDASNSSKIVAHICPWTCSAPFVTDQDRLGFADYRGASRVQVKLQPGLVYYIAIHAASNATETDPDGYRLTAPAGFSLELTGS